MDFATIALDRMLARSYPAAVQLTQNCHSYVVQHLVDFLEMRDGPCLKLVCVVSASAFGLEPMADAETEYYLISNEIVCRSVP